MNGATHNGQGPTDMPTVQPYIESPSLRWPFQVTLNYGKLTVKTHRHRWSKFWAWGHSEKVST